MKLLTNASLPTSSNAFKRVNILFDEKFIKITADAINAEDITETIDLGGKIILPGGVDAHTHLISEKSPGKRLAQISKSALRGGWTTLAELSYFSPEPVFSLGDLKKYRKLVDDNSYVDMAVWASVNMDDYPYHAEAAQELWAAGVVGIALTNPPSNPAIPEISFTEIMDLFMDIYESDTAFAFQGFDVESAKKFSFDSQRDAIKKLLRRMQENPIHIPRIASWPTIEFINSISKRSDISFAICIADLMKFFGAFDLGQDIDLDDPEQQLFTLLRTNKIYMLSNNTQGSEPEKGTSEAYLGTPESFLPYSYHWALSDLWRQRKVPLATVIKMTSENAAKRLGLYPRKGCLENGSDADFIVFDPNQNSSYTTPDGASLELEGTFESIYIRGRRAFHKGKAAPAEGRFAGRVASPKRRHNNTTWI